MFCKKLIILRRSIKNAVEVRPLNSDDKNYIESNQPYWYI